MTYESIQESTKCNAPGTLASDAGRLPIGLAFGTKSNNGERSGATPYWRAISRPRSRGILWCNVYFAQHARHNKPWSKTKK